MEQARLKTTFTHSWAELIFVCCESLTLRCSPSRANLKQETQRRGCVNVGYELCTQWGVWPAPLHNLQGHLGLLKVCPLRALIIFFITAIFACSANAVNIPHCTPWKQPDRLKLGAQSQESQGGWKWGFWGFPCVCRNNNLLRASWEPLLWHTGITAIELKLSWSFKWFLSC